MDRLRSVNRRPLSESETEELLSKLTYLPQMTELIKEMYEDNYGETYCECDPYINLTCLACRARAIIKAKL